MASINDICNSVVGKVDDGLGCAVVDLESGLLLGVAHKVPYFTQSYLDAVAAAAVDMFRGRTVRAVEDMIGQQRGSSESVRLVHEIQMSTEKTFHFMQILPNKPNTLLVLITGRRANLGMGWSALRNTVPLLEPLIP